MIKSIEDRSGLSERKEFRKSITEFHSEFEKMDGAVTGDELEKLNPLKHIFADGLYIREIKVPANQFCITKIHKKKHPLFLLSGKISILSEHGKDTFTAPHYVITLPGTQRAVYSHTDCVLVSVHATTETEIDKVEEEVIAKDFNDPEITEHDMKLLMEEAE